MLFLRGGSYIVRDCAGGEDEEGPKAAQREHHDDGELHKYLGVSTVPLLLLMLLLLLLFLLLLFLFL